MNLIIFGDGYVSKNIYGFTKKATPNITCFSRKVNVTTPISPSLTYQPYQPQKIEKAFISATHIISTVPPCKQGLDPILFWLKAFKQHITAAWIGYLSSTGVYGDHQGDWVFENSFCKPLSQRGIARLNAEKNWYDFYKESGLPIHIFRIAGIYGPKQNVLEKFYDNTRNVITKHPAIFSRIHIDDLVRAIYSSCQQPSPGLCFNIADDLPSTYFDVQNYAAKLLGLSLPTVSLSQNNTSDKLYDFYRDSKKISNQKIKETLNIQWQYPSYKEGLTNLFHLLKHSA